MPRKDNSAILYFLLLPVHRVVRICDGTTVVTDQQQPCVYVWYSMDQDDKIHIIIDRVRILLYHEAPTDKQVVVGKNPID